MTLSTHGAATAKTDCCKLGSPERLCCDLVRKVWHLFVAQTVFHVCSWIFFATHGQASLRWLVLLTPL